MSKDAVVKLEKRTLDILLKDPKAIDLAVAAICAEIDARDDVTPDAGSLAEYAMDLTVERFFNLELHPRSQAYYEEE